MLKEVSYIRQIEGEPRRRWFEDEYFDLIVWFDQTGGIQEFELCYDKGKNQRALRWVQPDKYSHFRVDDGENLAGRGKATPILLRYDCFDRERVLLRFEQECTDLEKGLARFVRETISRCPLRKTAQRPRRT